VHGDTLEGKPPAENCWGTPAVAKKRVGAGEITNAGGACRRGTKEVWEKRPCKYRGVIDGVG